MTVIYMPRDTSGVIHSKGQLSRALNYIVNPEKTKGGELVSGQNINVPNNAKIKLKQLFNEFDFLISKGLDFDTSFEAIGKELEQTYYQTESILENLQKERIDLHKTLKQVEKEMLYYDKSVDRYEDYQQEHTKNKSQHSPRL